MKQKLYAMMRSIFSTKKPLGNFKRRSIDKHSLALQFRHCKFGLRRCRGYRQMCWGDIQLLKDADGTKYLHFSERQTKTRSRANPLIVQPIKPKAFATPDFLPHERHLVVVFKICSEKRPESLNKSNAPFYLFVKHTTKRLW